MTLSAVRELIKRLRAIPLIEERGSYLVDQRQVLYDATWDHLKLSGAFDVLFDVATWPNVESGTEVTMRFSLNTLLQSLIFHLALE